MNERLYDFEDLEDYLLGNMSDADRRAFESALQTDENLRRRVEALQKEKAVLRYLRRAALKEKMTLWRAEYLAGAKQAPAPPARFPKTATWTLVLTAAFLLLAFWYFCLHRPAVPKPAHAPTAPRNETPAIAPDTPGVPGSNAPGKLPPPSAPQAGVPAQNWRQWAGAAYTPLLKKDVLMGAPEDMDIADSILALTAQNRLEEAFRLAFSLDTTQSAAQLQLAHIAHLKRDYAAAAHWYGRLKDNPGNARFHLDAQLNEIACYMYLMPGSAPVLKALMRPVMEQPQTFGLSGSRLDAFEQVWKQINYAE